MPENSKASKSGLMFSVSDGVDRSQRHLFLKIGQLFGGNTGDNLCLKNKQFLAELMRSLSVEAVQSGKDSLQMFTKPVLKNTALLHEVLFNLWTLCSVLGLKIHMHCFEINDLSLT